METLKQLSILHSVDLRFDIVKVAGGYVEVDSTSQTGSWSGANTTRSLIYKVSPTSTNPSYPSHLLFTPVPHYSL